jgi:hypothetical protein
VLVLPEDDHNREIALGFELELGWLGSNQFTILPVAGGWLRALARIETEGLNQYAKRFLVLVIDFDGQANRIEEVKAKIPAHLQGRVFALGSLKEPKDLDGR